MTRENKFRVWDNWNKVMLSPRDALLKTWKDDTCDPDNDYDFCFKYILLGPEGQICVYDSEHGFYGNPSSKDGCQYTPVFFTGLKDSKNNEEYYSDIIKTEDGALYEIMDGLSVVLYRNVITGALLYFWKLPYHEVIGNIYENSELLK